MLTKFSFQAIDTLLPSKIYNSNNLKNLYDFLDYQSYEYKIISQNNKHKKIHLSDLENEIFIDLSLKKDILKLTNCTDIHFVCGNTDIKVMIYHKESTINIFISLLLNICSYICSLGYHNVRKLDISIYLLNSKRILDNDYILDKKEVNGGSCRTTEDHSVVSVWRKEEVLKVLIHELFHAFSYDYKSDTIDIINHYQRKYNVSSSKMNTFEGYTEFWAECIHCYWLSLLLNSESISRYDIFISNLSLEIEFSRIQASKILSLIENESNANKETNIVAYYLIVVELMNNLNDFLLFCFKHNTNIFQLSNESLFLNYLKKLKKVKKIKIPNKQFIKKTTRMTCLELNLF